MNVVAAIAPLALGGAQFGLDYGLTNRAGRIGPAAAGQIFAKAVAAGVTLIDTAPAYGASEETIGALVGSDRRWRVVSKTVDLAAAPPGHAARRLTEGVYASLARLGRSRLDALLFHRARDLDRDDADELIAAAEALQASGCVGRLGVSVYDAADIDLALSVLRCEIVQLPVNLLDQRLIVSGHLARLQAAGVEVHARSALLQGVLACSEADPPLAAQRFVPALRPVWRRARDLGLSPLELALAFVRRLPAVSACILGVSGVADLEAALAARVPAVPDLSDLAVDDPDLIDPRRWPSR